MGKKKYSSTTFQDEFFSNLNCKLWIVKIIDEKSAKCNLSFKEICVASNGVIVLNSNAEEKNMKSSFSKIRKC